MDRRETVVALLALGVSGTAYAQASRFAFVVVRRDGGWPIVHHRSSVRPKPAR